VLLGSHRPCLPGNCRLRAKAAKDFEISGSRGLQSDRGGREAVSCVSPPAARTFYGSRGFLTRRKIMRKARSKNKRPLLLADLERRYRESPRF
jgi:hypothetical protein